MPSICSSFMALTPRPGATAYKESPPLLWESDQDNIYPSPNREWLGAPAATETPSLLVQPLSGYLGGGGICRSLPFRSDSPERVQFDAARAVGRTNRNKSRDAGRNLMTICTNSRAIV